MIDLFGGIYKGKKVFLTGHTGFKGSWMAFWLSQMGAKVMGYSLEAPTNPNHLENLNLDIESVVGDIRNRKKLKEALVDFAPDIVFHMAAQPLVRLSYKEPFDTFETNIMGSLSLYEAVRESANTKVLVTITTDKVYENNEWVWGYRENDRLGGKDPYSASKGAMEIVTNSYRDSFFNLDQFEKSHNLLMATVRAGNVVGGGDWAQDRLIPDIVKSAVKGETVCIRSPHAVRPWQHVMEPLSGYLLLGQKLWNREVAHANAYNFGPEISDTLTVEEVVRIMNGKWDQVKYKIEAPKEKLHEAGLLKLDITKAKEMLNWKPVWGVEKTLEKTIEWYREFYSGKNIVTLENLEEYIKDARSQNVSWTGNNK